MIDTRPTWAPGPPPPADGLRKAFHDADARRAKKAVGLTVPTLAVVAGIIFASLPGSGTSSLRVTPANRTGGSPSASAPASAPEPASPGSGAVQNPAAGAPVTEHLQPPAGHHSSATGSGSTRTGNAALPEFSFDASRSARTVIKLTSPRHPDMDASVLTGGRTYRGLWLVNSHGAAVAAVLEFVQSDGSGGRRYSTAARALPAGSYSVYVVGDAPLRVHVPLEKGEAGVRAHATQAVAAAYRASSHTVAALEQTGSVQVRVAVPVNRSAVGFGGGFYRFPGGGHASITVCVPRHGATCGSGDPSQTYNDNVQVAGASGAAFSLTRALVADGRDILTSAQIQSTGDAVVTSWSFTVSLT